MCVFLLFNTVQEKPTKGPVQGDRAGNIPVFGRLFTDNLRRPSVVRNHKSWGEFWSVKCDKNGINVSLFLMSRLCLESIFLLFVPQRVNWNPISCRIAKKKTIVKRVTPEIFEFLTSDSKNQHWLFPKIKVSRKSICDKKCCCLSCLPPVYLEDVFLFMLRQCVNKRGFVYVCFFFSYRQNLVFWTLRGGFDSVKSSTAQLRHISKVKIVILKE